MKKQLLCILLAFSLLFACMPAHARPLSNFFVRMRYGQLVPYENIPFRYAIDVYNGFRMYSEAELDTLWANLELDEDDDEVYDFRYWMSPDNTYEFVVQVKEQTYDSFATEIDSLCLGSIYLLEQLPEVREAPAFISLLKDVIKDTVEFHSQIHVQTACHTPLKLSLYYKPLYFLLQYLPLLFCIRLYVKIS